MRSSGAAILKMAMGWITYIPQVNDKVKVPEITLDALMQKSEQFGTLFQMPSSNRTPAMNAQMKTAKNELVALMRDIKRRYFFSPPLTDADLISLELKPRDTIPTPIGDPVGLVTATTRYVHEGALELSLTHVAGSPFDKRANYGVKIRYAIAPADAPPITDARDMQDSRFTRKKKELFTFEKKDAGKKVYFCMRYENSKGKAGQWGPVMVAGTPFIN